MQAHRRRIPDPPFDGGAQPVPERPPDEPGRLRAPAFWIVALLAFLSLAMPVAWGLGYLATMSSVLGTAARLVLWMIWLLVVGLFVWIVWSMWRRAA
ncbi:MAG TPA: hypothetical protein VIL13_07310 [Longimicrobiales bacterium]